jgi:hypothetical protein
MQVPQDPPHPSPPQSLVPQSGMHTWTFTHFPSEHCIPLAHVPQSFPHSSTPHSLPAHEPVQTGPVDLHTPPTQFCPDGQDPHVPSHPSSPQTLPVQSGVQSIGPPPGMQNPNRHVSPAPQFPHDPPHPSSPHMASAQSGVQGPMFPPHPPQSCAHSWTQVSSHSFLQQ